jgi:hypothetical protein
MSARSDRTYSGQRHKVIIELEIVEPHGEEASDDAKDNDDDGEGKEGKGLGGEAVAHDGAWASQLSPYG